MTPVEWVLFLHLQGVATYDRAAPPFPSREACERAGREWLAQIKHRSPNDFYECFQRRKR